MSDPEVPRHTISGKTGKGRSVENPLAKGLNIAVSIPETIEIKMVDASALADYEIWFFISSLLANAVVGFGVAYFQDTTKQFLWYNTLVFLLLFLVSVAFAFYKRYKLRQKAKTVRLRASEIEAEDI